MELQQFLHLSHRKLWKTSKIFIFSKHFIVFQGLSNCLKDWHGNFTLVFLNTSRSSCRTSDGLVANKCNLHLHKLHAGLQLCPPLKFNMEREKQPFAKEMPFGNHHFQVPVGVALQVTMGFAVTASSSLHS